MNEERSKLIEDNIGELQKNIDKLVEIRDQPNDLRVKCPHCKKTHPVSVSSAARDKNRIEASKGIGRHLGALQPDRSEPGVKDPTSPLDRKLSAEEQATLDEYLKDYHGEEPEMVPKPM